MYRIVLGLLALLPAPAAAGQPQDRPKDEKPVTATGEYRALMDEYQKALRASDAVFAKATTEEERRAIRADFRKVRVKLVGRFLAFAETHPKDKEALEALFFVLHPDIQAEDRDIDKAAQLILKDHVTSDRLGPILRMLAERDFAGADTLLRSVSAKNPHHALQAQACLSLAQILKQRADAGPPGQAARLTAEAEDLFQRVVDRYADVAAAAETAKAELFGIRHLAVGKTAPDIKGTDSRDQELKLSDYRGKVVVLDFWAEW
jgi:AhpC/TSA family